MLYPAGNTTAAASCLASLLRGIFFIICTLLSTVMVVESEPNLKVTGWNWAGVLSTSSLFFLQPNKTAAKRKTEITFGNLLLMNVFLLLKPELGRASVRIFNQINYPILKLKDRS